MAPTGTPDQPWGPTDKDAQIAALMDELTPGQAQAVTNGDIPKSLSGKTPLPPKPKQQPAPQRKDDRLWRIHHLIRITILLLLLLLLINNRRSSSYRRRRW